MVKRLIVHEGKYKRACPVCGSENIEFIRELWGVFRKYI